MTNVFRLDELPSETAPAPPGFGSVWYPLPGRFTWGGAVEELAPRHAICPLHYHLHEEEMLYLLEGELTVRELEPHADSDTPYREFTLRTGELIVWAPRTGIAHQTRNDSDAIARYLVLSTTSSREVCIYPDSGKMSVRGVGVGVYTPLDVPSREARDVIEAAADVAARRPVVRLDAADRPSHVSSPSDIVAHQSGPDRPIETSPGRAAGARYLFVNIARLPPRAITSSLHAHLADEELVMVLSGHPTLRQVRGRREGRAAVFDGPEERLVLGPRDAAYWAPQDLVAHQLVNETEDDAVLLVIGTDCVADDIVLYPERGEVLIAALAPQTSIVQGAFTPFVGDASRGRLELTDYYAGEVAPDMRLQPTAEGRT